MSLRSTRGIRAPASRPGRVSRAAAAPHLRSASILAIAAGLGLLIAPPPGWALRRRQEAPGRPAAVPGSGGWPGLRAQSMPQQRLSLCKLRRPGPAGSRLPVPGRPRSERASLQLAGAMAQAAVDPSAWGQPAYDYQQARAAPRTGLGAGGACGRALTPPPLQWAYAPQGAWHQQPAGGEAPPAPGEEPAVPGQEADAAQVPPRAGPSSERAEPALTPSC